MLSSEEGRSPCTQSIILMVLDAPSHRGKSLMPSLSHSKNMPMFTLQKSKVRLTHEVTVRSHSPSWPRLSSSLCQDTRTISASSIHAGTKVSASVLCIIQRQADIQRRKKSSPLENLSEERCFLEASKFPSHWVTWIFPLLRRWDKP